jgi:2-polyprenyl-3-methyl-5-hydroxy-6-metoxy-1,4-benzoquinol methylase
MHTGDSSAARSIGLYDAALSGWFNTESGEVYRGVPIGPDDVVVDVGCGEGGALGFCADLGAHVIGIDHDEESLERVRHKLAMTSARKKECFASKAETLPLADGTATRVLCTEVLEHVDDPSVVLRELMRIGAPGSIYLITVPDPVAESVQQTVAPPLYFQRPNHLRIFARDEFAATVAEAGLEITHRGSYGFYWAVWWAMFWACDVDLAAPDHPALNHWSEAWDKLLHTPDGPRVQQALDAIMPKSQVIVARKPGEMQ